jgi:hypothetical protein
LKRSLQPLLNDVCYVLSKRLVGGIITAGLQVDTVEGGINGAIE